MKLSQPRSARTINTARILCELRRAEGVSKADLSRILELNKVSCGEIVSELETSGLVREAYKVSSSSGRRPTALEIIKDARHILCVNIGYRNVSVALTNLDSEIVRMERLPYDTKGRVEEFCASLLKSCLRTVKLLEKDKLLGVGISVSGRVSADGRVLISSPYLPWRDIPLADVFEKAIGCDAIVTDSVRALIAAEKVVSPETFSSNEPVLYVDWSDSISLALVSSSRVRMVNPDFGRMKLRGEDSVEDLCTPRAILRRSTMGASEGSGAVSPDAALPGGSSFAHLRDMWTNIPEEYLSAMSNALDIARQVTGAEKAVLSGESAGIDSSCLSRIRAECLGLHVDKSALGDNANVLAASEFALDRFFYQYSLLDEVRPWI